MYLRLAISSLLALVLPIIPTSAFAGSATKPNIVFILADDVGREVLGCYGGLSYRTPHLDRLAEQGAKFEYCHSMPVCHPTRVCLLTGRYPRHLGNPGWGGFPNRLESQTFAHLLKKAGYRTAIAGKWQLCLMKNDLDHPKRLGFDEWSLFGWHEGSRYYDPMIYQNGELRQDTEGKYGPDLYVDFLIDFVKRSNDQPFFAYYSMALCHDVTDDLKEPVPYGPRGRYDNYAEMAEKMDVEVGRLLDGLEKIGALENTLILFTTDNGTARRSIIRAENGKYIREPVVSKWSPDGSPENVQKIPGGKGTLTDWGTRIPMIAVWPGQVKPGQVWDDLIDFSDILPTFAELAGAEVPRDIPLDGVSFAKRLTSGKPSPRQWAYAERGNRFYVKTRRWKLYSDGKFFDLKNDMHEKKPLTAEELPADARDEQRLLEGAMAELKTRD